MKQLTTMLALCLFAMIPARAQKGGGDKTPGIDTLKLDRVVNEVNLALALAEGDLQGSGVEMSSAEVTLQTIRSLEGGGGFNIFVKASKKWQLEKASSIKFAYAKDSVVTLASAKGKEKIHDALRKAIIAAAKQWNSAGSDIHGLKKESFTVEVSFGVTKTTGGGFEFEVWGVGIEADGSKELSASHSVSLTFKDVKK